MPWVASVLLEMKGDINRLLWSDLNQISSFCKSKVRLIIILKKSFCKSKVRLIITLKKPFGKSKERLIIILKKPFGKETGKHLKLIEIYFIWL